VLFSLLAPPSFPPPPLFPFILQVVVVEFSPLFVVSWSLGSRGGEVTLPSLAFGVVDSFLWRDVSLYSQLDFGVLFCWSAAQSDFGP